MSESEQNLQHLYRHFDADGNLLYVGISLSAVHRLSQHKKYASWFSNIKRVEIEHFATRKEVLDAERIAVATENPKCNTNLRKHPKSTAQEERQKMRIHYAEQCRIELTERLVRFDVSYDFDAVMRMLGIGKDELNDYIKTGDLQYFEILGRRGRDGVVKFKKRFSGWAVLDFLEYLESKVNQ